MIGKVVKLGMLGALLLAGQVKAEAEETERSLTIYANGAQISETQRIEMVGGIQSVAIEGLPRGLDASSLYIRPPAGMSVLGQSFDVGALNRLDLLRRYLGRSINLARVNPANGAETVEEATLLAIDDGPILKIGERIEIDPPGRIVLPGLAQGLETKPILHLTFKAEKAARAEAQLSYLLDGLSWQVEYLADLDPAAKTLNLSGRFAVANYSGSDFSKVRLYLAAGEVSRASSGLRPSPPPPRAAMSMRSMASAEGAVADSASVEEFGAHQLFLPQGQSHFTLTSGRTTQLYFFEARALAYEEELTSYGNGSPSPLRNGINLPSHPRVILSFKNEEKAIGLATPLPGGIVQATQKSRDGALLFAGSNHIPYTAIGGVVKLELGSAGDIGIIRTRSDFTRPDTERRYEIAWRIEVTNARESEAKLRLIEPIAGDWQMLSESEPHKKTAADIAEWRLKIPGKGKAVLEYRVLVKQ